MLRDAETVQESDEGVNSVLLAAAQVCVYVCEYVACIIV